jgi:hypothetical protein
VSLRQFFEAVIAHCNFYNIITYRIRQAAGMKQLLLVQRFVQMNKPYLFQKKKEKKERKEMIKLFDDLCHTFCQINVKLFCLS